MARVGDFFGGGSGEHILYSYPRTYKLKLQLCFTTLIVFPAYRLRYLR